MSENSSRENLDPAMDQMRQTGYALIDRFVAHLESLSDQKVAQLQSQQEYDGRFGESFPEHSSQPLDGVEFFFDRIVPGMTRVNHPRFHAFIPCPSSFAGAIGMMMAAATNPFVGSWLGGASIASLELMVLNWIKDALQLNSSCEGILTSGGSMANLIGLAAARAKYGREVLDRGVIYVSDEGHTSVNKAAQVLGFVPQNISTIPTNALFQMDLEQLELLVDKDRRQGLIPFFVSANAGTTNTGAIDDLSGIARICQKQKLWFHVDAAYGGFAAMVPETRALMRGMEMADSLTLDPHKWLYCPMGVGCAFVKERDWLEKAFSAHGTYLKDLNPDEVNFLDRGPELSRPARVLPVWMVMRSSGKMALMDQIKQDIDLAALAAELLANTDWFEIVSQSLSIVTFRLKARPNESEASRTLRDDELVEAALVDGDLMLSSTTLKGKNALRFVVMNPRTSEDEVRRSVYKLTELAGSLFS